MEDWHFLMSQIVQVHFMEENRQIEGLENAQRKRRILKIVNRMRGNVRTEMKKLVFGC